MNCVNCGKILDRDVTFCPQCGKAIKKNPEGNYDKKGTFIQRILMFFEDDDGIAWSFVGAICPIIGIVIYSLYGKDRPIAAKHSLVASIICIVAIVLMLLILYVAT